MNYSVLMSVYHKEKPEFLKESMLSIFNQTVRTDDFILVCDGPLNDGLDSVIGDMQKLFGSFLTVVRLAENKGLGNALNEGMMYCRNELIARMDSDDISRPERCSKQLNAFIEHPEADIISGTVEEFTTDPEIIDCRRVLPETNQEILQFAKRRNPFNHPCVMYKKTAVLAAGGYQDFYLLEDYFLWIRMLISGAKGYNIQEPLLWMRAGSEMYKRRSGMKYAKSQKKLFLFMRNSGVISNADFIFSTVSRYLASVVPNSIRKIVFTHVIKR